MVAKYHGQGPATAISFYDHEFRSVLCKVRAKACVICSLDSVSVVASVNLIFKPLKKIISAYYESCSFQQQAVSVVGVIKSYYLFVDCGRWPSWLQNLY
jgi:hypothetical protein